MEEGSNSKEIDLMVDPEFAGTYDSKSVYGYLVKVVSSVLELSTRKQTIVALSNCDSEYAEVVESAKACF